MPASPAKLAEMERIAGRVRVLVGQGLERQQIMDRLSISKGHATRLIRDARNSQPLT